ncbi:hypothetical protein V6N13_002926 [Hibiscus sabdariffa]|uniref:Uncharacterized protein n=2 Tax=Hibiscus sabdariffa TaxID=183260 RepID=A0ABR2NYE5_9ROSI
MNREPELEEKVNNQDNHMETTCDRNKLAKEIKEVSPEEDNMEIDEDKTTHIEMKKVNMLISSKQLGKNEEIIVVEVGSILLELRVLKMDAKDRVNGNGVGKDGGESSSESFVESVRRTGSENAAVDGCLDEVESFNDVLIGKEYNDYVGGTLNLESSQIGERELLGCDSHVNRDLLSDKVGSDKGLRHMESQGVFVSRKGPSWVEVVTSNKCIDPYLEDC